MMKVCDVEKMKENDEWLLSEVCMLFYLLYYDVLSDLGFSSALRLIVGIGYSAVLSLMCGFLLKKMYYFVISVFKLFKWLWLFECVGKGMEMGKMFWRLKARRVVNANAKNAISLWFWVFDSLKFDFLVNDENELGVVVNDMLIEEGVNVFGEINWDFSVNAREITTRLTT